jgi:hypothetical protein
MKNIIYGQGVSTPGFNIIAIVFGIGQTKLPDANFARIILTTFLWFCLIFRTAYQSLLFEYEATDMTKPLPQTIEDLYTHNFTIVTNDKIFSEYGRMIPENLRYLL